MNFIIVNPTTGLFVESGFAFVLWTADLDSAARFDLDTASRLVAMDAGIDDLSLIDPRPFDPALIAAAELQIVEVPA